MLLFMVCRMVKRQHFRSVFSKFWLELEIVAFYPNFSTLSRHTGNVPHLCIGRLSQIASRNMSWFDNLSCSREKVLQYFRLCLNLATSCFFQKLSVYNSHLGLMTGFHRFSPHNCPLLSTTGKNQAALMDHNR